MESGGSTRTILLELKRKITGHKAGKEQNLSCCLDKNGGKKGKLSHLSYGARETLTKEEGSQNGVGIIKRDRKKRKKRCCFTEWIGKAGRHKNPTWFSSFFTRGWGSGMG